MTAEKETVALLKEIRDLLRGLRADFAAARPATPVAVPGEVARQVLDQLRAEVQGIPRRPGALRENDATLLGALLPLLKEFRGGENFTSAEVLTEARANDELRHVICDAFSNGSNTLTCLGRER